MSGPSVEQQEAGARLGAADLQAAERVAALLPATGSSGVALSGGVDSSVLLALAARSLGRPGRARVSSAVQTPTTSAIASSAPTS